MLLFFRGCLSLRLGPFLCSLIYLWEGGFQVFPVPSFIALPLTERHTPLDPKNNPIVPLREATVNVSFTALYETTYLLSP